MTQQQTHQDGPSLEDFFTVSVPTDPRHWLEAAYDAPDAMSQLSAAATGILSVLAERQARNDERLSTVTPGAPIDLLGPVVSEGNPELEARVVDLEAVVAQQEAALEKRDEAFDEILAAYGKSRAAMASTVRDIITKARTVALAPEPEPAEATTVCQDCGHTQGGAFTNCADCSSTNVVTEFPEPSA